MLICSITLQCLFYFIISLHKLRAIPIRLIRIYLQKLNANLSHTVNVILALPTTFWVFWVSRSISWKSKSLPWVTVVEPAGWGATKGAQVVVAVVPVWETMWTLWMVEMGHPHSVMVSWEMMMMVVAPPLMKRVPPTPPFRNILHQLVELLPSHCQSLWVLIIILIRIGTFSLLVVIVRVGANVLLNYKGRSIVPLSLCRLHPDRCS